MGGEFSRSLIRAAALGLVLAAVVGTDQKANASSYTIVAGGAPVTVTTTASGETARATFSGTSGRSISLKISGVTMSSATVAILKPDGTTLVAASIFGVAGKFVDKKALPVNGTYTIVIDPTNAVVGSATLTLYDVPADATGSLSLAGPPLTLTTTVPGQNAKATFTGTSGQRVSLKIGPTCCSLKVTIKKPDGTNLVAATSIGSSGGFIDTKTLPANGTYAIVVDPQSSTVGAATLTLYLVPADVVSSITPGGAPVTVTTTTPGQNAKVTFAGTSGQRVALKVAPTCCSLTVTIQKPDGTNLVAATAIGTSGGFIDTKSLPVGGTYTIIVNPQSAATGSVTLTLYLVAADVVSSITPGGTPLTLTTTTPGQNAKATFTGVANRGIALQIDGVTMGTSTTASFKLSIKKPDGTYLLAATLFGRSGGFIDTKTLPASGTYTIVVDPQADATGSVTLTLYDVPPQVTGTITSGGAPVSLTFTAPYQNGRVTFSGTAGERVTLGINFAPTACCTVNVSINKPDGTRLVAPVAVASGNGSITGTTLPVTGTYTIVVDPFQTATGTVTLTLADLAADVTASATLGGPAVTVTTTAAGQNARVTFTGAANDGVVVKLGPANCCAVAVSVLKPDGTTLAGPTTFSTTGGSFYLPKLPVDGTYTVLLDYVASAIGSVTVQLIRDNTPPTPPTLSLAATTADGFGQGTTFFYRPAGTGSVNVTATTSDPGSGINRVLFPALSGGFTPTTTATDSAAPYVRTYSWSAGATLNSASNTVTVTDNVGNTSSATFAVVPDSTPPTTTDNTAAIGNAWKNTNQTVILSPTDGTGSGVGATYHTINGSTPTTVSPTGTSFTLSADGSYTIKYFSVDKVSNSEAVQTGSTVIRIDKTSPTTTMTAPAANANIRNGQVLTATASDAGSGVASVSYYYCAGTGCTPSTLIGTSSTGPNYSITWSAQPADGPYVLQARATDVAGNVGSSANRSVTIDNTPPVAPVITVSPPNPSNSTAPSFSFTGEPGATFACSLDGAAFASCTSPKAYTGLSAGSHTFQVRQTDTAGNTSPNRTFTWTIDTTAPAAPTLTGTPSNPSNSTAPSFSFTGEVGATFQCQLDGGAFAACTSPKGYTGLAAGSHTFHVRQMDAAGNTSVNGTYTWTIDVTPPAAPSITANPPGLSNSASASFSFTGEGSATFECELDGIGFSTSLCTSPKAYSGLSDGSHTFGVRQTDSAGNTGPSATYTWFVDTTAPQTTIDTTPPDPSAADVTFFFSASETSTFECSLDGAAFGSCNSPASHTGLAPGSHTFDVRATDAAGNIDPTPASYAWTVG
jgi:hypothetical protein